MTVWTLDELRAVTQPMWPDSDVEFLFRVREVLVGDEHAVEVDDYIDDTAKSEP